MKKRIFKIQGMHCASCALNIESSLKKVEGVRSAKVNFAFKKLYIEGDVLEKEIEKAVFKAGDYKLVFDAKGEEVELKEMKETKKRMIFAIIFSSLVMILMMIDMFFVKIPYYFLITYILGFPVIFIAGYRTHKASLKGILRFSANMDTLVTMGSLIPYLLSLIRLWFPMMTT